MTIWWVFFDMKNSGNEMKLEVEALSMEHAEEEAKKLARRMNCMWRVTKVMPCR